MKTKEKVWKFVKKFRNLLNLMMPDHMMVNLELLLQKQRLKEEEP